MAQPNFFELSGNGVQITYSTTSIDGSPRFSYHDSTKSKQFSGSDEIKKTTTGIGTLVSVVMELETDSGETTFTLLVPHINLSGPTSAAIRTDGITTRHKTLIPIEPVGQNQIYTIVPLEGTASIVLS